MTDFLARGSSARIRRVVVVRPNSRLGNALLLTPLIQELETLFPEAEIDIVSTGPAANLIFEQYSRVRGIHSFPGKSYLNPAGVLGLLIGLKRRSYDIAIDPSPRSRAGRFILGHLRADAKVGYLWNVLSRDRMLTCGVDGSVAPPHCGRSPVFLVRAAFGQSAGPILPLELRLTPSERIAGVQRLQHALDIAKNSTRPIVGLFASASGQKSFTNEWWRSIVTIVRSQRPAIEFLEFVPADGCPRLGDRIAALHTPDLRLFGATLAATSLVVSGDCGVMHLAGAAGARVLGLFKVTDPARYGPIGPGGEAMMATDACAGSVAARIEQVA